MLYINKCSQEYCGKYYTGEAGRYLSERKKDHGGGDNKLNILKHSTEKQEVEIKQKNFKI